MTEKIAGRLEQWRSGEGIDFISPEAKTAFRQRAGRIADVIRLKRPDRVPVAPSFGMFSYLDQGLTCEEACFDPQKAADAALRTLEKYEPDMFLGSGYALPGRAFTALDYRQVRWPGRDIPAHYIYQFVEGEYVTAQELYDLYLEDPSDFMLRIYLPRTCGHLKPLARLKPWSEFFGYYLTMAGSLAFFGLPEVQAALGALMKAGEESLKWTGILSRQAREIKARGFPRYEGGDTAAPYDLVGDWFRGTAGVMTDMYRYPDRLLAVMERLVPLAVKIGLSRIRAGGNPIVGLRLHKGADGFMSPSQFETFYWPTLKKVMLALIEAGCVPMLLFEGEYTSRLETIADIPRATCIYCFEKVDWGRAKDILGGTVCLRGGIPASLLHSGTVDEVKARVREMIDLVGRDGGYIVDCGIWFDEAKSENVKAMIDYAKEYGVYG